MNANEKKNSDEYLVLVDEITSAFTQEMKQKYGLHCWASGGRMPYDVEELDLSFSIQGPFTIEEARRLEVQAITKLLDLVNQHEKIRPYLREYPFKSDRVCISISFPTQTGERPLDGSVASVLNARNKVIYKKAAIVMTKPHPHTDIRDPNNPKTEMIGGGPKVKLITIKEEPYEDALNIVKSEEKSFDESP
ncbi:MAG: hypothetical protein H7A38_04740 [Chlamydiales bacterium]|nr:hypothetical protein [Chlamydiales bacterium]